MFFRKKSKTAPPPPPRQTPLSAFVRSGDGEPLRALLRALPARSEVIPETEGLDLPVGDFPALCFCTPGHAPTGRFVLPAFSRPLDDEKTAKFLSELSAREGELVVAGEGLTESALFSGEKAFAPRAFACAADIALYTRAKSMCEGMHRDSVALFAPLLLSQKTAFLDVGLFAGKKRADGAPQSAEQIARLWQFFNECKPPLDADRYRFAFDYVCDRTIAVFADLALKREETELRVLDENLRRANMALRVAIADRAPMRFVDALRKNGYRLPLPLRAAARLTLLKERSQ